MAVSKPDAVSELLRRKIMTGEIQPGERINVRSLETDLNVSHIPIREAIRRLEAEGLIDRLPNVGAVATKVSLEELEELYDFRRFLEPALARRAVANMSDEQVGAIFDALEALTASNRSADGMDAYVACHREFHWRLLEPGASVLIERTLDELWRMSERYLRLLQEPVKDEGDKQHELMAQAAERRDDEALSKLLSDHLELTLSAMRATFDAGPFSAERQMEPLASSVAKGSR